MHRMLGAALVLVTSVAVGLPSAWAGSYELSDPEGDVLLFDPDSGDWTKGTWEWDYASLRVAHHPRRVVVRVGYHSRSDTARQPEGHAVYFDTDKDSQAEYAFFSRSAAPPGERGGRIYRDSATGWHPVCVPDRRFEGMREIMTIPRACLGRPGTVRATADFHAFLDPSVSPSEAKDRTAWTRRRGAS